MYILGNNVYSEKKCVVLYHSPVYNVRLIYEPRRENTSTVVVRKAQTQISLDIRPV